MISKINNLTCAGFILAGVLWLFRPATMVALKGACYLPYDDIFDARLTGGFFCAIGAGAFVLQRWRRELDVYIAIAFSAMLTGLLAVDIYEIQIRFSILESLELLVLLIALACYGFYLTGHFQKMRRV